MINLPFRQFFPLVTPHDQSEIHHGTSGKGILSHSVISWRWSEPRGIQSSHQLFGRAVIARYELLHTRARAPLCKDQWGFTSTLHCPAFPSQRPYCKTQGWESQIEQPQSVLYYFVASSHSYSVFLIFKCTSSQTFHWTLLIVEGKFILLNIKLRCTCHIV